MRDIRTIAAVFIVAVLAVSAVGVAYAYQGSTTIEDNSSKIIYSVLEVEDSSGNSVDPGRLLAGLSRTTYAAGSSTVVSTSDTYLVYRDTEELTASARMQGGTEDIEVGKIILAEMSVSVPTALNGCVLNVEVGGSSVQIPIESGSGKGYLSFAVSELTGDYQSGYKGAVTVTLWNPTSAAADLSSGGSVTVTVKAVHTEQTAYPYLQMGTLTFGARTDGVMSGSAKISMDERSATGAYAALVTMTGTFSGVVAGDVLMISLSDSGYTTGYRFTGSDSGNFTIYLPIAIAGGNFEETLTATLYSDEGAPSGGAGNITLTLKEYGMVVS